MEIYEKEVFEETVEGRIKMCNDAISAMNVYLDKGYDYEPFIKTKECCEEYKSYLENVKDRNFDELTEHEFAYFDYRMSQNYLTQAEYLLELLNMDLPKEVTDIMNMGDKEERDNFKEKLIVEIEETKNERDYFKNIFESTIVE